MPDVKKTGIWIDSKKAVIVSYHRGDKTIEIVESGFEGHEREEGEGDQQGKFGGQFVSDEHKVQRKKEQDVHEYLKEVISHLEESDALIIFGPAEVKTQLVKELDNYPEIRHRVRSVKTVDSMTNNQIAALVKTHYNL